MKMKKIKWFIALFLAGIIFTTSIPTLAVENNTKIQSKREVFNQTTPLIEITDAHLQVYETQGGKLVSELDKIPKDSYLNIFYSFQILDLYDAYGEEGQVKEGDYFTIDVPTKLADIIEFEEISDRILEISYDGDNYNMAKLNVTKNDGIKITFLKDVESLSDVTVNFSLGGFLQPDKIKDGDKIDFALVANGTVYSMGFISDEPELPQVKASVKKSGAYNKDTNEITWTVTLDTGDLNTTITDVLIKDMFGDNQTFVTGSTVPTEIEPDVAGNIGTFSLSKVTGVETFHYKTTPTKDAFSKKEGETSFVKNVAELYYGEEEEPKDEVEASVELTTNWIEKSGVARTKDGITYIDWTIGLNYNHQTILKDSQVSDTLPKYLILEESSVKRNGSSPDSLGDKIITSDKSLTYQFGADTKGEQSITFTTKVEEAYYQQQAIKSFANTAMITVDGVAYEETSKGVEVSTNLLNKYGGGYNPATKAITWRLHVNENGQVFTNATIMDSIATDQLFDEEYGIQDENGVFLVRVSEKSNLKMVPNQYYYQDGELEIYLGDMSTLDKPVLYFQTFVTNPNDYANNKTTDYSNHAILTGDGITDSNATGVQSVKSQVISKENTGYDYTARLLSWRIIINQNNMILPDAIMTDYIASNQTIVLESIAINAEKPESGQVLVEDNKLIVKFGNLTTQKIITFQTKVTDLEVFLDTNDDVTFQNTAQLESGILGAPNVSVSAKKIVNNKALSKGILTEYTKENGYIEWEVYVNANQAPLKDAILDDVLQEGLELDADSVVLYEWQQDSDGNRIIGDEVSSETYTFTYDYDTRNFLVYLPKGEQGYYLKFKTDVLKPGQYSNSISFGGAYIGTDSKASSYYVTNSDLSAGVSGTNGSIRVYKTNEEGQAITTGAEFELLDSRHNVIKTLTTDENGTLTFNKLKLRTYYIREKTAPRGYENSKEEYKVVLSGSTPEQKNQTITIKNSVLTGNIFLKKVNQKGEGLVGGVFSIYDEADTQFTTPLDTVMSKEEGIINFQKMKAGTYVIKEVKAPAGYIMSDEVKKVVLTVDSEKNVIADVAVEEAFVNEAKPFVEFGSVRLLKSDEKGNPLKGAEFGLYDIEETLLQTTVSKENGTVEFTNVPYGTYTIKEIKAPKGYKVTTQSAMVVIHDSSKVTNTSPFIIVNEQIDTDKGESPTDNDKDDSDDKGKKDSLDKDKEKVVDKKDKKGKKKSHDNPNNDQENASNTSQSKQDLKQLIQAGSFWDEITLLVVAGGFVAVSILIQYVKRRKKV